MSYSFCIPVHVEEQSSVAMKKKKTVHLFSNCCGQYPSTAGNGGHLTAITPNTHPVKEAVWLKPIA
jgi:hypothetical protein